MQAISTITGSRIGLLVMNTYRTCPRMKDFVMLAKIPSKFSLGSKLTQYQSH